MSRTMMYLTRPIQVLRFCWAWRSSSIRKLWTKVPRVRRGTVAKHGCCILLELRREVGAYWGQVWTRYVGLATWGEAKAPSHSSILSESGDRWRMVLYVVLTSWIMLVRLSQSLSVNWNCAMSMCRGLKALRSGSQRSFTYFSPHRYKVSALSCNIL
jgi:hypothetical protein